MSEFFINWRLTNAKFLITKTQIFDKLFLKCWKMVSVCIKNS